MTRLPRLVYLQYVRAIAAFAVVLYHMGYYGDQLAGFSGASSLFSGFLGYFGVVAFFTISGYLMSSLIQETTPARFLAHRFLRIYPIYWILVGLVYVVRRWAGMPRGLQPLNLLLIPLDKPDGFLNVEWTLIYEVFYYALTAPFCLPQLRRFHTLFLTAWLAVCLGVFAFAYPLSIQSPPTTHNILTSMWNIPFLMGGLGYYALQRVRPRPWWFLVGVAMLLASDVYGLQARGVLGPLSCALILLFLISRNEEKPPKANEVLLALGDYSYGLYLVHVPVILLGLGYLSKVHPRQEFLDCTIVLGLCLAAGTTAGSMDIWLYRHLKRFADARLARPVSPPSLRPAPVGAGASNLPVGEQSRL